jgi:hypothetical protein
VRFVLGLLAAALVVGFWSRRALARRGHPRAGAAVLLLLLAPFVVLGARAAVPWTRGPEGAAPPVVLRPGVVYERRVQVTPRRRVAHVLRVDLEVPGLRLAATRPDDAAADLPFRARTTSAFAEETGAIAAINGDFFEPWAPGLLFGYPRSGDPVRTLGATWSRGERVPSPSQGATQIALGPGAHVAFGDRPQPGGDVVGGLCMLVAGGEIADLAPCRAKKPWQVHPRSAIAVDRERSTLLLVVVDGRQPRYSAGAELDELAALLLELGAHDAMNLDGGGSSTLVARGEDGRLRTLGSPIADRIPGRERPIANHIGVYADPPPR